MEARALPRGPWKWTDDTEMAQAIFDQLEAHGTIDEARLAKGFGARFHANRYRGYGGTAQGILECFVDGIDWKLASSAPFSGTGSKGNGAAMRVAPLGAFFADDLPRLVEEARRSAIVTHFHPEGQAGAIAVALAAALAWNEPGASAERMFERVLEHLPRSVTREGVERAADLGPIPSSRAAEFLGSGQKVLAEDTVPFAIWCAAHQRDFVEAMWTTVAGGGDRDTTCAIVGGIVARGVPAAWIAEREALSLRFVG